MVTQLKNFPDDRTPVSSSSCANFALKRTAEDNEDKAEALALDTIHHNFYVADCLRSAPNENQAIGSIQNLNIQYVLREDLSLPNGPATAALY